MSKTYKVHAQSSEPGLMLKTLDKLKIQNKI